MLTSALPIHVVNCFRMANVAWAAEGEAFPISSPSSCKWSPVPSHQDHGDQVSYMSIFSSQLEILPVVNLVSLMPLYIISYALYLFARKMMCQDTHYLHISEQIHKNVPMKDLFLNIGFISIVTPFFFFNSSTLFLSFIVHKGMPNFSRT